MIPEQHPPIKIVLSSFGNEFIAILPEKYDIDLVFRAFEGLLISAGYTHEQIKETIKQKSNQYGK